MKPAKAYGCAWCGSKADLELDHIIPRSAGGSNSLSNFQWLCKPCHRVKTDQDKEKYKKKRPR